MADFMFLKLEIKSPSNNNETWEIPAAVTTANGMGRAVLRISDPDLNQVFVARVGRSISHKDGPHAQLADVVNNFDLIEQDLAKELLGVQPV